MKITKITIHTISILAFSLYASSGIQAQDFGISTSGNAPAASAILDLNTGNSFTNPYGKGLLIPNVALTSSTDATTISTPAYSLLVYNPGTAGLSPAGFYYNSGTPASPVWTQLGAPAGGNPWLLLGNSNTTPVTNFLGTTDGNALEFKVDNQKAGWLDYTTPYNTFFGYESGNAITTGTLNTALGFQALASNAEQSGNTAIGDSALYSQNFGTAFNSGNVAVGNSALYANNPASTSNSGNFNTAVGEWALRYNTIGYQNTAVGYTALYSNINGYQNTAVGGEALYSNTAGIENTAVGVGALYSNTVGNNNTATGYAALYNNVGGNGNTATGYAALYRNVGGNYNTATGDSALYNNNNTTPGNASYNTADGAMALYSNTSGLNNTADGMSALYSNTTGSSNSAFGFDAGYNNTQGNGNVFIGDSAGYFNTTGFYNTFIGYGAGAKAGFATVSNTTCLGYLAGVGSTIGSNSIYLGYSTSGTIYALTTPGITTYSDRRIKDDIEENVPGLNFITKLHPVTYHLDIHKQNLLLGIKDDKKFSGKYDIENINQSGFIAQQVDSAAKACGYDFCGVDKPATPGGLYGLGYTYFIAPLTKAVQDLNDSLQLENKSMQSTIAQLQARHQMLKAQLASLHDSLQQVQQDNVRAEAKNAANIIALKAMLKSMEQLQHDTQQMETIVNK